MTLRRLLLGLMVVVGFGLLLGARSGTDDAQTVDPVYTAGSATTGGGNEDDAAYRYRTNQARHWRQVAIGSH